MILPKIEQLIKQVVPPDNDSLASTQIRMAIVSYPGARRSKVAGSSLIELTKTRAPPARIPGKITGNFTVNITFHGCCPKP